MSMRCFKKSRSVDSFDLISVSQSVLVTTYSRLSSLIELELWKKITVLLEGKSWNKALDVSNQTFPIFYATT
jgi:hypothetical protein